MALQDADNFVVSDAGGTNYKVAASSLSSYVSGKLPSNPWTKSGSNVTLTTAGDLVGIGGGTQSGYKLKTHGKILATDDITAFSDLTLKDDVQVIDSALEKLLQIRGVTFVRNDTDDKSRKAGVIAQEVEKVLPEVVGTTDEGLKNVAYGNLVALLIEAIKELNAEIENLKSN